MIIGPVVLAVACLLSIWVVLRAPAPAVPARATAGVIVISTLIPVGSVSDQTMALIALSSIVALSLVALVRRPASLPWPTPWVRSSSRPSEPGSSSASWDSSRSRPPFSRRRW